MREELLRSEMNYTTKSKDVTIRLPFALESARARLRRKT